MHDEGQCFDRLSVWMLVLVLVLVTVLIPALDLIEFAL